MQRESIGNTTNEHVWEIEKQCSRQKCDVKSIRPKSIENISNASLNYPPVILTPFPKLFFCSILSSISSRWGYDALKSRERIRGDAQLLGSNSRATDLDPASPCIGWGPNPGAQSLGPKSRTTDLDPDNPLTALESL